MGERTWLNGAMHAGFYLLLAASAARVVVRHEITDRYQLALAGAFLLAVLYGCGVALWDRLGSALHVWLGLVLTVYVGLVFLAPSFAWCAVPLYFLCLRLLPAKWSICIRPSINRAEKRCRCIVNRTAPAGWSWPRCRSTWLSRLPINGISPIRMFGNLNP